MRRVAVPVSGSCYRYARLHISIVIIFLVFVSPSYAQPKLGINNTKHNLSVTGPGPIAALTETRICIFCHTPHNSAPSTPLWNKSIEAVTYVLYSSSTLGAALPQPSGPSRLCLSCHDGTLALGAVLRPAGGISVAGQITAGRPSYLSTVLSGDHPFSFSYDDFALNPYAGLSPTPPLDMIFYGSANFVECTTCHDPHEDAFRSADTKGNLTGKFLVVDNQNSALCLKCHSEIDGWSMSSHRTSTNSVLTALPVPPREWPTWLTVEQWGCEGCHVPHSAGGTQWLLNYESEENNCFTCHSGNVALKNIYTQFQKLSRHPVEATTGVHDPKESSTLIINRHVECTDCHNPHASNDRTATAPNVSGRIEKVSGMALDRGQVNPARYEYEICFKCHADLIQRIPYIPRVLNNTNTQETFSQINPSYHPVLGARNLNLPSIPSTYEPSLTPMSIIYCSDCHSDDTGESRGPHGSNYPPILKYQYETTDNTFENAQNYALCYRCHNRTSILSDESFNRHHLHIVDQNTPCSACHDAHGVADNGLSGSHTHLINFDTRIVSPTAGNLYPIFTDNGIPSSGSCTLICHGVPHNNLSY